MNNYIHLYKSSVVWKQAPIHTWRILTDNVMNLKLCDKGLEFWKEQKEEKKLHDRQTIRHTERLCDYDYSQIATPPFSRTMRYTGEPTSSHVLKDGSHLKSLKNTQRLWGIMKKIWWALGPWGSEGKKYFFHLTIPSIKITKLKQRSLHNNNYNSLFTPFFSCLFTH